MRLSKFEKASTLYSKVKNFSKIQNKVFNTLANVFSDTLYLITNTHCIVCNKESFGKRLCKSCRDYTYKNVDSNKKNFFYRSGAEIYYYGQYEEKLREFILSYKFRNHHSLAREFSQMLYETIKNQSINFDIIAYVPATKSAKKKRGYDHMRLIAQQLSKITNKPYIDLLMAVRETDQLKTQNRKEAVKGKFKINEQKLRNLINKKAEHLKTGEKIEKKKILLIDDVYTTGSTINECINTLKINGLENIIVLVIAINN